MNERSRFNHPEEAIEHASVRGGIELARVSERERRELWDWYRSAFGMIDAPRRVELLEQFVGFGLADPNETLALAERLLPEERGSFGDYLGKTTEGTAYLRAFHECWNDLPADRRAAYVRQFTKDEPERLAMVAPFMDVTKLDEGERPKLKNVLVEHASSFDRLSELLGAVLDYERRHPYVPPVIDRTRPYSERTAAENAQRSPADYLVSWLKADTGAMSLHLLAHVPFLIGRGWMTREEAAGMLTARRYVFSELQTDAETEEINRIHAGYRSLHPEEDIPARQQEYYSGSDAYRRGILEASRPAKLRAVRLISDGFLAAGEATSRRAVLKALTEESLPWAEGAERMRATAEDVVKTMESGVQSGYGMFLENDPLLEGLLRYARRAFPSEAATMERMIVDAYLTEQTDDGYDSPRARAFVVRFKDSSELFSKENVRRVVASLAARLPGMLLLNSDAIRFARANGIPFDARSAVEATLRSNATFFLTEFALVWKTARECSDLSFSELREAFVRTVRHSPFLLFRSADEGLLRDLVPCRSARPSWKR